jgi:hypothetical protein
LSELLSGIHAAALSENANLRSAGFTDWTATVGEPLFQVIPLLTNVCGDLEGADVRYAKLADNPELQQLYDEWSAARKAFHEQKAKGMVSLDAWQKDYFLGRDTAGRLAAPAHATKVRPPKVQRDFGEQSP